MSILFKNLNCQISYQPGSDFIEVNWFDFPKSTNFKDACNALLIFMKDLGIKKLLTNNTQVKLFSVTDQRWLNNEWLPKAEALGYYCSATVAQEDVVVKATISNITNRRNSKFIAKRFTNIEDAKYWLANVKSLSS
jgi:hypothetical protein